jgi:hypothetical protein
MSAEIVAQPLYFPTDDLLSPYRVLDFTTERGLGNTRGLKPAAS